MTLRDQVASTIDVMLDARKKDPTITSISISESAVSMTFGGPAMVDRIYPIPVIETPKDAAEALRDALPAEKPKAVEGGRYKGVPESEIFAAVEGGI